MTFKHVKFEDSAVMRSLEKVASQKGLVKSDPLKKTASKQTDLFPTTNLTENILKLCEGLRHQGFNKYADELEDKFVVYKQAAAATLYETSPEEGKDLVDAAHPKGSHHLEGLDSDEAVIETILDQHLKDTKVVEKKPTGKLSSSRDILRAVKFVLAQEVTEEQLIPVRAERAIEQLKSVLGILGQSRTTILNKMNTTTLAKSFDTNYNEIANVVNALTPETISIKSIDSVIGDLGDIQNSIDFFNWKDLGVLIPGIGFASLLQHVGDFTDMATGDWDQALRDKMTGFVNKAKAAAKKARAFMRGEADAEVKEMAAKKNAPLTIPTVEIKAGPLSSYFGQIAKLKTQLNTWKAFRSISQNPEAMKWIAEEIAALDDIDKRYDALPEDQEAGAASEMGKEVNEEAQNINQFQADWVSAKPSA
jgi:hypothetical protein